MYSSVEELVGWDYDEGIMDQDPTPYELGLYDVPSTMRIRPYQQLGIAKMRRFKRFLNRDRPGMGKTPQAAFAAHGHGKVLIVAPSYLTGQWYEWLKGVDEKSLKRNGGRVIPNVAGRVRWITGSRERRLKALRSNKHQWYIINQEMLQAYADEIISLQTQNHKWPTIIFDESHHLRNHRATRSQTAFSIAKRAERVFTLTATPIWKEVDDLYMQFHLLHPDEFSSYIKFVDLYCIAENTRFGTKVLGVKQTQTAELKEILDLVSIGRTYKEVGRELPSLIEKPLLIDFPPELRTAYDEVVDYWRTQVLGIGFDNWAQVMNGLRQFTFFPGKLAAVKEFLDNDAAWGKVVVFTWYKDHCDEAARVLGGISIHGDIKDPNERRRLAMDPKNRVVCATISALSEGVDLSMARTVVFLEEHWPPGANDQALSRVQRDRNDDGQDKEPIVVYYAHVPNTIDTHIHKVASQRADTQSRLGLRDVVSEALGLD